MKNHSLWIGRSLAMVSIWLCFGVSEGLIIGKDSESKAAAFEKEGKFKEAAVWRLVTCRAYKEIIIPFEVESVREFTEWKRPDLAKTCANRAEVLYPDKAKKNRESYEQALAKAGGERVRAEVEREATRILAEFAPIPLSIPSRLKKIDEKQLQGDWLTAAEYREVAGRVYLRITVPFFEKEAKKAGDEAVRRQFQSDAIKYLKLAQESYAQAAESYKRAAEPYRGKSDAESARLLALCTRKSAEMKAQEEAVRRLGQSREGRAGENPQ